MDNQITSFFDMQSLVNPSKIQDEIYIFSQGGENKERTSPLETNFLTATKLLKTYTVKQECQGDKGKQELHPDRSDETSNEQKLEQNSEKELRKKEQELQEKEKEIEELKRRQKDVQHTLQQQDQENKTLTARFKELEEEMKRLEAAIKNFEFKEESEKQKEENEEELRKKKQELQEKEKEIEKLKRKQRDAQHKLQQQDQENKTLTARIKELEKEIKRLNDEIIKLKEELKNLKEELDKIKGNEHNLRLAAMSDQLQKNFYVIVFYPHDFSKEKQSYKEKEIEDDINEGFYGLTTDEKKRQARERWEDLKKKLGWNCRRHVKGIVRLKYDRNLTAHPKITKDMKESLEDGSKALKRERKLDEPTFGIVQNLIDMWFKTEDLVQEQEKKKNKEQTA